jgi:hypothetical protein
VALPFLRAWQEERLLRRRAASYVQTLAAEPDPREVEWLARELTGGDVDRARWELRYARRALGLLVAGRDALDDRTASVVARELSESLGRDRNVAADKLALAEKQLNTRLRAYGDALSTRGAGEPTSLRLARALVASAGFRGQASAVVLARAGEMLGGYVAQSNEALRAAFGTASLPEDVAPSQVARSGTPSAL